MGLFIVVTDLPRPRAFVAANGSGAVIPTGAPDEVGAAVAEVLAGLTAEDVRRLAATTAPADETSEYAHLAAAVAGC